MSTSVLVKGEDDVNERDKNQKQIEGQRDQRGKSLKDREIKCEEGWRRAWRG